MIVNQTLLYYKNITDLFRSLEKKVKQNESTRTAKAREQVIVLVAEQLEMKGRILKYLNN